MVQWKLLGLQPGVVEPAATDDVDHLDFYIFRNSFIQQRGGLPVPTVAPGGGSLSRTFPWGKQGAGKPSVQPGTVQFRFPIDSAVMRLAAGSFRANTSPPSFLNIDFQVAPYPNPSGGTREQVHFGIDSAWMVCSDRRLKNSVAIVEMTMAQYADVFQSMMAI